MIILGKKYEGYQDVERNVVLQDGLEDVEPYHIVLPEPPKPEEIINFGLPYKQQFFKRVELPYEIVKLNKLPRNEAISAVKKNRVLAEFVHSMWVKMVYGEWQYIRGKPFWISPDHWFQLNFCFAGDAGYFDFREVDAKKWWWWDLCVVKDEMVYGGINMEGRRGGKTFFLGHGMLRYAITNEEVTQGIQSKTDDDAKEVFQKSIVKAWKRLPFFFMPKFANSSSPKDELDFSIRATRKTGDDTNNLIDTEELNSRIFVAPMTEGYFDGYKLNRLARDEAGKIPEINVEKDWEIHKLCLVETRPSLRIIGKALYTSTIEDLDKKGGKYFKSLYERSSRLKQHTDSLGRTKSGLIPYFIPAYEKEVFDQYGFSIVDEPLDYQQEYLKTFKKEIVEKSWMKGGRQRVDEYINSDADPDMQQDRIRKKPRNLREAFRSSNKRPLFNQVIINERLDFFAFGYPDGYMAFGNFRWKDGVKDSEVEWVTSDISQARFHIKRLPPEAIRNNFYIRGGEKFPGNQHLYSAGADPFKFNKTKYKGSNGAGHVYEYFNPNIDTPDIPEQEWVTDNFCVEYLARPTLEEYCEDMLMMCVFYGCKMFPEHNVDVINNHFIKRGYRRYLKYQVVVKKQSGNFVAKEEYQAGGYTNDQYLETLYRYGNAYVDRKAIRCPFYRTLEHLRDMSVDDREEYDLGISALYTLTGAFDTNVKALTENKAKKNVELGLVRKTY